MLYARLAALPGPKKGRAWLVGAAEAPLAVGAMRRPAVDAAHAGSLPALDTLLP